ncbi:hypothetical protein SMC5_02735 [Candidatus Cryosericum odellii]|uniref:Glycosyltransferase RgtA/B/C/D-like domain-containing protein n=3 Tax=Candidatus Cryosericum odellii TaxID=2290917 RepID=A0A398DIK6_9BACT|nr:hypothetical protein SMC5_02735 [Candidatus Cryosericum odellii]
MAVDQANKIVSQGWQTWELQPSGQAPAGIMGAVYALTGVHEPWTVIPVYAALYATAGILLWLIVDLFLEDRHRSLLCLIPYICLPSAAMILYSQPNKDIWQIVGFFCFVYGWSILLRSTTWKDLSKVTRAFLIVLVGAIFSWIVRPYCVQIMQAIAALLAVVLTLILIYSILKKKLAWFRTCILIVLVWMSVATFTPFTSFSLTVPKFNFPGSVTAPPSSVTVPIQINPNWTNTNWLPSLLDQKLAGVAAARDTYTKTAGNGNIDDTITFHSARDMFLYLPRAIEIGFLSPFPRQWFESGSTSYNTLFRRVSAMEMIITYLSELLLVWGVIKFWRRSEIWVISISSITMIMLYALTITNIGTLYRERWGYMVLLITLGFAILLKSHSQNKTKTKQQIIAKSD